MYICVCVCVLGNVKNDVCSYISNTLHCIADELKPVICARLPSLSLCVCVSYRVARRRDGTNAGEAPDDQGDSVQNDDDRGDASEKDTGSGKHTYSRQPTENLRGGGVVLSNSAPRRAAASMWSILCWIGEKLSVAFNAWDRMRRDNPIGGLVLLVVAMVIVIGLILPFATFIFLLFAMLFVLAVVADSVCFGCK